MLRKYSIKQQTGTGLQCDEKGNGEYTFTGIRGRLVALSVDAPDLGGKDVLFSFVAGLGERKNYPPIGRGFTDYPTRANEFKEPIEMSQAQGSQQYAIVGNFTIMVKNADPEAVITDVTIVVDEEDTRSAEYLKEIWATLEKTRTLIEKTAEAEINLKTTTQKE